MLGPGLAWRHLPDPISSVPPHGGEVGSLIRYTLDASEQRIERHGLSDPIILTQGNDKTGKVVRAAAFLPGWLPSEVKTHTYCSNSRRR